MCGGCPGLHHVKPPDFGRVGGFNRRNGDFFGTRMGGGHIAGHPFLQQQIDRLHHRNGVEPGAQLAVLHGVGDRGDGHPLMMGHETADDGMGFPLGQAGRREIDRLVKSIAALRPHRIQPGEVGNGSYRVNHSGKASGIGGHNPVLT